MQPHIPTLRRYGTSGLLLPASFLYPRAAAHFLNRLRACMAWLGLLFAFTFGEYISKINDSFSLMVMQNYNFGSASLFPPNMLFNKVIYCKHQAKEGKQPVFVEHLLLHTFRVRKTGVGGTPTGLLILVSQRCWKWNLCQGAICLWQRTCNRVSSENHFRGPGWKISSDLSRTKISIASSATAGLM